jgi:hypothetical protein
MNERIRELAEQAGGEFYTGFAGSPNSVKFMEQDFEKFAELIVKECVNVVEGGSFLHDQAPTAIFAKECSAAIKRHFDIK